MVAVAGSGQIRQGLGLVQRWAGQPPGRVWSVPGEQEEDVGRRQGPV